MSRFSPKLRSELILSKSCFLFSTFVVEVRLFVSQTPSSVEHATTTVGIATSINRVQKLCGGISTFTTTGFASSCSAVEPWHQQGTVKMNESKMKRRIVANSLPGDPLNSRPPSTPGFRRTIAAAM
jgi:hypothetical protein